MAWVIRKDRDAKNVVERHLIEDGGVKGEIVQQNASAGWQVNLMMMPDLRFESHSLDRCVGYVRGVEATVNLYAKETELAKKRCAG